jgi:hypothetical protein
MGTRGSWGFILDGKRWETYNHFDSYPDALGDELLKWAQMVQEEDGWETIADLVRSLKVVKETAKPTPEQWKRLREGGFVDDNVSTGTDFYAGLRRCQGNPALTLSSGFWLDATDFHQDGLFCEWSYVFDLDAKTFQVFEGRQVSSGATYTTSGGSGYASVLIGTAPFSGLPRTLLSGDGVPFLLPENAVKGAAPQETIQETPQTTPQDPVDALVRVLAPVDSGLLAASQRFERLMDMLPEDPRVPAPGPYYLAGVRSEARKAIVTLQERLETALAGLGTLDAQAATQAAAERAVAAYPEPVGGPISPEATPVD